MYVAAIYESAFWRIASIFGVAVTVSFQAYIGPFTVVADETPSTDHKVSVRILTQEQQEKMLNQLRSIQGKRKGINLKALNFLYSKWKTSEEWQEFVERAAAGEVKEATELERFYASLMIAGVGHVSALGPNSFKNLELGRYIQLQARMNPHYGAADEEPDIRRLAVSKDIAMLKVSIPSNENNDKTFQQILWEIISTYDLSFTVRDDTLYLMKKE